MSVTISIDNMDDDQPVMSLANGNFGVLWSSLGLRVDWCGLIDPRAVLTRLRTFDAESITRPDVVEGNTTSCGIGTEQARSYVERLTNIAELAERQENLICWG